MDVHGIARAAAEVIAQTCSLVAPRACPCGAEGAWLCPACRRLLHAPPVRVESCCGALQLLAAARVREGGPHLPAGVDHEPLLPVLALGEYGGDLQRLVLAWKNGGMLHLGGPIAAGLTTAVHELADPRTPARGGASHPPAAGPGPPAAAPGPSAAAPWLVPVPSRWQARLRRGEDHTAELVRALERRGAGHALLLRAAPSTGQEGKGARARRTRRIRLGGPVPAGVASSGAPVVIIDDVVTTGATLRGMHEALSDAGLRVLGAVVVASARLPPASHGWE